MIFLLQSLLVPWLIGFLFLGLFAVSGRAFRAFLAIGIGFGISSCCYFLLLVVASPWKHSIALIEYALLLVLAGATLYLHKKRVGAPGPVREGSLERTWWPLLVAFLTAIALSSTVLVMHLIKFSHGGWDAWAIWNLRARFLFRGGEHWNDAFSTLIDWSHPDYPLLIPGLIARCWEYMGRESVLAPALIAALFTCATVGLVFSALAAHRGRNQALIGALVLASTPFLVAQGASQCADVPLSFYFLATLAMLYFQDRAPDHHWSWGALAGVAAGFAAWTKNEGLLFIAAVVCGRMIALAKWEGLKTSAKRTAPFLIGVAPVLLLVLYFKLRFAPSTDLFGPGIGHRLLDFGRYGTIAGSLVFELLIFGGWYLNPLLLLAIYALCLGVKFEAADRPSIWSVGTVLLIMLGGYAASYAMTPLDLTWHIWNSVDRLLLQLWPSFVFLYLLVVRAPERVPLGSGKRREKSKGGDRRAPAGKKQSRPAGA